MLDRVVCGNPWRLEVTIAQLLTDIGERRGRLFQVNTLVQLPKALGSVGGHELLVDTVLHVVADFAGTPVDNRGDERRAVAAGRPGVAEPRFGTHVGSREPDRRDASFIVQERLSRRNLPAGLVKCPNHAVLLLDPAEILPIPFVVPLHAFERRCQFHTYPKGEIFRCFLESAFQSYFGFLRRYIYPMSGCRFISQHPDGPAMTDPTVLR